MRNKHLVGLQGNLVVIGLSPHRLTPDEALEFAAFLVALAEPWSTKTFAEVLEQVKNT